MPDARTPRHTLADHAFGALAGHAHGERDLDHDHDDDFLPVDTQSLESVPLVSMGLDIGSSGTQIAFTRLEMRGPGEHRALRRQAKRRETLYLSPVVMTPLRDDGTIDEARLRGSIASAFAAAGLTPDDIETGAVILTGEAARRGNAERIAHLVAEDVGELVCAAAGDHMEAMLAAHGSGAVEVSRAGAGSRLLNVDIGGATTKFSVVDHGRVVAAAALGVGGRLVAVGRDGRVIRLDPMGAEHARRAGRPVARNELATRETLDRIAEAMAEVVIAALVARPLPANVRELFLTPPILDFSALDGVMFSGGVAEYIYAREDRDFGDLGRMLGRELRRRIEAGALPWPLLPAGECIRATVLGAAEHTVQLSGQTIYISNHAALLPRRNLPVLRPDYDFGAIIDAVALARAIAAHREAFDLAGETAEFALAFRWRGPPEHARVRALAEAIGAGLSDLIARRAPLYVMVEGDAALTLGGVLHEELGVASDILVIDGIVLRDFDFVDIGRVRLPSFSVPVTIKSLLFGGTGRG